MWFVNFVKNVWSELEIAWNIYLTLFAISVALGVMCWGMFACVGAATLGLILGIAAFLVMFVVGVHDILHPSAF